MDDLRDRLAGAPDLAAATLPERPAFNTNGGVDLLSTQPPQADGFARARGAADHADVHPSNRGGPPARFRADAFERAPTSPRPRRHLRPTVGRSRERRPGSLPNERLTAIAILTSPIGRP